MDYIYILSQILIVISTTIFVFSLQLNDKNKILFFQIFSTVFFFSHFYLLNETVASLFALLSIFRLIVFYYLEKKKRMDLQKALALLVIVLFVIPSIITWQGVADFFPFSSFIMVTFLLGFSSLSKIKLGFLYQGLSFVIYMILIGSIFGIITQLFVFFGALRGYISYNKRKLAAF